MTALLFLGALIAPLMYAFTNHIDKILLEKYFKEGGVGTLMIFSALLSVLIVPVALYMEPAVLEVGILNTAVLAFVGLLNVVLLWCYLQAMEAAEPTTVIIFYQLVPVLGLGLGYLVLGETISWMQGLAMALIICGATVMVFATDADGKLVLRLKSISFMFVASFCWAAQETLFKKVALEENVWRSLFWESLSMTVLGFVMFFAIPKYRKSFLNAFETNSRRIIGLNVLNETLYIFGNAMAAFMVVLIPIALNLLMNSFQPIFVFIIGIILSKYIQGVYTEKPSDRWQQKIIAVILTSAGVYIIGDW